MTEQLVTINTYHYIDDAYLARTRLEGSGIEAIIPDEAMTSSYWLYSNAVGGVRLQVLASDVESAREVLGLEPVETSRFRCPHCQSERVAYRRLSPLTAILYPLAGVFLPMPSRKMDCLDCKRPFSDQQLEKFE